MIRLLIVDDEKQIRMGLEKTIPWEKLGISEVYTAQNAMDGLKLFYKYNPDIVLADIKMPGMTGLEMCQRIRQQNKDTVLFLLSGYMNTQFTRLAITIGISEYFMKPIDVDEVMNKVSMAVKKIEAKLETNAAFAQSGSVPLLCKKDSLTTLDQIDAVGLDSSAAFLVCILVQIYTENMNSQGEIQRVMEKVKDFLASRGIQAVYYKQFCCEDSDVWLIYASYRASENYEVIINELYEMTELCNESINESETLVAISAPNSISDTFIAYEQAFEALQYGFFYGSGNVLEYTEVQHVGAEQPDLDHLEQEITQLNFKDSNKVADLIVSAENILRYGTPAQISRIKAIIVCLMMKIGCNSKQLSTLFDKKTRYLESFFDLLHTVQDNMQRQENSSFSGLVRRTKAYIDAHYTEDISIEELGNRNGKSANYISHIFKKETGIPIVSYINKLRIEEACNLLRNTDLTVYEIARVVGFKNHNYFAKIFKQFSDVTPLEYRKKFYGTNE